MSPSLNLSLSRAACFSIPLAAILLYLDIFQPIPCPDSLAQTALPRQEARVWGVGISSVQSLPPVNADPGCIQFAPCPCCHPLRIGSGAV